MKKMNIIIILLTIFFVFLVGCNGEEEKYTLGLRFEEYTNYCAVSVGDAKNEEHIIIPRKYNNKPVTAISDYAFHDCKNLVTIELPDTLLEIENNAFEDCKNLKDVKFPNSIERIGKMVFAHCSSFDTIVLPKNINGIGHSLFYGSHCEKLIIQDASTIKSIGSNAFDGCEYVLVQKNEFVNEYNFNKYWDEKITMGKVDIRYNVSDYNKYTSDGTFQYFIQGENNAFGSGVVINELFINDNNKGIISLPNEIDGIKVVDVNVNLYKVRDSMRAFKFEKNAIYYPRLELSWLNCPILFEDEGKKYPDKGIHNCYEVEYDEELKCLWASITGDEENVKIIKFYYEDEEIENLIIPEEINGKKVVELCESSYSKVKATNLILPKNLKIIGEAAFLSSTICNITFNDKLEIIDDGAFYGCVNLKEITFPLSLKEIGETAFQNCTSLEKVTLNEGLLRIEKLAFYKTKVSSNTYIPESVTYIGDYVFSE